MLEENIRDIFTIFIGLAKAYYRIYREALSYVLNKRHIFEWLRLKIYTIKC